MKFYSLKHRKEVDVPEQDIVKRVTKKETKSGKVQERYMLVAKTKVDGEPVTMMKFVNKDTFDKSQAKMEA